MDDEMIRVEPMKFGGKKSGTSESLSGEKTAIQQPVGLWPTGCKDLKNDFISKGYIFSFTDCDE